MGHLPSIWYLPILIDKLNNQVIDGVMLIAVCFNILTEIPSGPLDFEVSRWLSSSNAFPSAPTTGNVNSVEWNDGMERWNGLLEWSTGLDYWSATPTNWLHTWACA